MMAVLHIGAADIAPWAGWPGGWMDGWMDGAVHIFATVLQQQQQHSPRLLYFNLTVAPIKLAVLVRLGESALTCIVHFK